MIFTEAFDLRMMRDADRVMVGPHRGNIRAVLVADVLDSINISKYGFKVASPS
jgi:hypothetical protein